MREQSSGGESEERARLRRHLDALVSTGIIWIVGLGRLSWWFGGINAVAVIALGVGSSMGGDLAMANAAGLTIKGIVVWGAVSVAILSNLLAFLLRDRGAKLIARAADLESEARRFLDERNELIKHLSEQSALDARRLALIDAGAVMLDTCTDTMGSDLDLAVAIETALRAARRSIIAAIDFDREEYWAISIFRNDGETLVRLVALRADPRDEAPAGRGWSKGEGFVGMAWMRDREVIIADSQQSEVMEAYEVPSHKQLPNDSDRYRSMAVVPIRMGPDDRFWGAVAVSSDRAGRFRADPGNNRVKNLDTVRLIASTVELLVAGFARGEA